MIWFWRRHTRDTEAERDLADARRQRVQAERMTEVTRSRWHFISEIVEGSRQIRRENHIVDDITTLFQNHPR